MNEVWFEYILIPLQVVNIWGWSISIATGLAIVYGLDQAKIDSGDKHLTVAANVIFAGFHRFAWALACAWVVFACCRGYGGNFYALLSEKYGIFNTQRI